MKEAFRRIVREQIPAQVNAQLAIFENKGQESFMQNSSELAH